MRICSSVEHDSFKCNSWHRNLWGLILFGFCWIYHVDMLQLTFESFQSQQKLPQGIYISKNSTLMLIDSRQCNSSFYEWEVRKSLVNRGFREGSNSSSVNPGSTGSGKAIRILWFFLPSKSCHSGTQLRFCALTCRLCGSPCHKGSVSTKLLCHLKDLTKSRWHLRILFPEQLAQRPPCQSLTPAGCIPQITSSRILRNIL